MATGRREEGRKRDKPGGHSIARRQEGGGMALVNYRKIKGGREGEKCWCFAAISMEIEHFEGQAGD